MIGSSKNNGENYPRKCFWTQERETRVKFNPGLSANRPSNNWAQNYILRRGRKYDLQSVITVIRTDVILGQDREAGSQVENFLRAVSADPADCPQVSEDA